jgi:NADH:ubiquinone oxidoreductase subunit 6 (subunit J)
MIAFAFFSSLTLFSAIAVAWQKNLLYAAFLLLSTFVGIAGLYLTLNADFLAATQLLIYVGGVLTLFLFGILITKRRENRFLTSGIQNRSVGLFLALLIGGMLGYVVYLEKDFGLKKPIYEASSAKVIGYGLMGDYLLPFELVGILLLVILIGVLVIASTKPLNPKNK